MKSLNAETERLAIVDSIRAFALFGVLLVNMCYSSGLEFMTSEERSVLPTASIDYYLHFFVRFFFVSKSITIFSMLFGFGMVHQLSALELNGVRRIFYLRRLVILAALGLLNMSVLLWFGDILFRYALVGTVVFFLLLISPKTIIAKIILIYSLFITVAILLAQTILVPSDFGEMAEKTITAFTSKTYIEMVKTSTQFQLNNFILDWSGLRGLLWITGIMLVGASLYYSNVFTHQNKLKEKYFLWGGLGIGIWGNLLFCFQHLVLSPQILNLLSYQLIAITSITAGFIGMALFYCMLLTRLFRNNTWKNRLTILQPMGKMALTNYLIQSAALLILFTSIGFGLAEKTGISVLFLLSVLIYILQIIFCRWWMRKFLYGPVEWLWRSLLYGEMQIMCRQNVNFNEVK